MASKIYLRVKLSQTSDSENLQDSQFSKKLKKKLKERWANSMHSPLKLQFFYTDFRSTLPSRVQYVAPMQCKGICAYALYKQLPVCTRCISSAM